MESLAVLAAVSIGSTSSAYFDRIFPHSCEIWVTQMCNSSRKEKMKNTKGDGNANKIHNSIKYCKPGAASSRSSSKVHEQNVASFQC